MPAPKSRKKTISPTKGPRKKTARNRYQKNGVPFTQIKWKNLGPMYDFWGKEFKRYYQLETMANAVEGLFKERARDSFLAPSIKSALGPAKITRCEIELFQEGYYQLIFRMKVQNSQKRKGTFALVVAKDNKGLSETAKREHHTLNQLYERAPQCFVRTLKGGTLFLPDRHRRKENDRFIYAYVTEWQHGYHELGIQKNGQFFVNIPKPVRMNNAQTQQLKRRMVEMVIRSYDPVKRNCMAIPQIASGDFVVTLPGKQNPRLKLIACRELTPRVSPSKLIHSLLSAEWEWSGEQVRLAPDSYEDWEQALNNALGKNRAKDWMAVYRKDVELKRYPKLKKIDPEFYNSEEE
jgi:hypothetical protein